MTTNQNPDTPEQTSLRIGQVYTLAEASKLTGLSVDALRQRANRGKLDVVKGNDKLVRVRLTAADLEATRLAELDQPKNVQTEHDDQTIKAIQDHLTSLRERLASSDSEAAALRERISEVERERETLRQDREDARVRAAAAEGEAKALREALAEARMSWPLRIIRAIRG